jgi:hypothetical protein
MQIAFFAVSELVDSVFASLWILLSGEEHNLQRSLIGRQLYGLSILERQLKIFGVNDELQDLFDTGILGALISIICAYFILIYWPVLLLTSCAVYVFL